MQYVQDRTFIKDINEEIVQTFLTLAYTMSNHNKTEKLMIKPSSSLFIPTDSLHSILAREL